MFRNSDGWASEFSAVLSTLGLKDRMWADTHDPRPKQQWDRDRLASKEWENWETPGVCNLIFNCSRLEEPLGEQFPEWDQQNPHHLETCQKYQLSGLISYILNQEVWESGLVTRTKDWGDKSFASLSSRICIISVSSQSFEKNKKKLFYVSTGKTSLLSFFKRIWILFSP